MEIELDFRKNKSTFWMAALALLIFVMVFGLAQIGRNVTPVDAAGNATLLGWSDWQLFKAERIYTSEIAILRGDVTELAAMLDQQNPNPVAAQLLADRVSRHAADGDPSLATARLAVSTAALSVRNWTVGTLDRDSAILAVQEALALLK
jgi:hypothetical protein